MPGKKILITAALLLCALILAASAEEVSPMAGKLVINELVTDARFGLTDADGEPSDWVELHNRTGEDILLKDYTLSDDPARPELWRFPENAVLPAGGYYLVFCSGKDKIDEATYFPHTNFRLSSEGETLVLSLNGQTVDRVDFGCFGQDVSMARDPADGKRWLISPYITPTTQNSGLGEEWTEDYAAAPRGSVYISEVMSNPSSVCVSDAYEPCDFIELRNDGTEAADLSGWGLSDDPEKPLKWVFPDGTVLSGGGSLTVMADKGERSRTADGMLHASFGLSKEGGETVILTDTEGRTADRLSLPAMGKDISFGRTAGVKGWHWYDAPTPGRENGKGFSGFAPAPVLSLSGGCYEGSVTVEVTVPENAAVRYTLDGSVPTPENGTVYTAPLTFEKTAVLRVRSFTSGDERPSEPVTASYILNEPHTLRVVSLVIEPDELWNEQTGMLADGKNAVKNVGELPFQNTVYRKYGKQDREAYVEIFEQGKGAEAGQTARTVISRGALLSLQGDYSLDMPQKSMKVKAKAELGGKYFEYPLFEQRPFTEYRSFVLRNSGNDCVWTRLIDCFQTELIERYIDTDIITLAYEPCAVYINGQYWGHYNMRERKDKYCIAQHEGLDLSLADEITIIKGNYTVEQGSVTEYKAMVERIRKSSPGKNGADKLYLDLNIDVESYLDWFAIEMFFGNSDPGNVMYYRLPGEESKWRCLIYDLDYGMFKSTFDACASFMKTTGMGQQKIVNTVFLKILEVPEYKDRFCRKLGAIYQALTEEKMNAVLDELAARIEPEMAAHFERWAGDPGWKLVNSDTPNTADAMYKYWQTRLSRAKNTTHKRPYYIYTQFKKQFKLSDSQMKEYFGGPCPEKPKD